MDTPTPILGQIWFDKDLCKWKICTDGNNWFEISTEPVDYACNKPKKKSICHQLFNIDPDLKY